MGPQPAPHGSRESDRARRGLPKDIDEHGLAIVGLIAHELRGFFERDPPERGEGNGRGPRDRDGKRAERGQVHRAAVDEPEVEFAIGIDEPDRPQFGDAAQGIRDRGGIETARLKEGGIEGDPRLEPTSPLDGDLGHAGQA